jgi:hypothetical protein
MREYNPHIEGSLVYDKEWSNGNSGGSATIVWPSGNKQAITLTGSPGCDLTFVDPPGACNLVLRLVQGAGGSKTATWPASVMWPENTDPTLSTTAAYEDIACFYFNGSKYYGQATMDFR